jgi:hypothetical protein
MQAFYIRIYRKVLLGLCSHVGVFEILFWGVRNTFSPTKVLIFGRAFNCINLRNSSIPPVDSFKRRRNDEHHVRVEDEGRVSLF